jgi:hypothetical protein
MINPQSWRTGAAASAVVFGLLASPVLAAGLAQTGAAIRPPAAQQARILKATDTAKLQKVSAAGSLLIEEGKATGTLPGKMHASVNVGATISGNFTIYTKGGTIKGHGEATPHGSGQYESFAGSVIVRDGTGRYTHAHGETKLYGTFNRGNYSLVIQTTGTLSY